MNSDAVLHENVLYTKRYMGGNARKPVIGGLRTTNPRSLISTLVIHFLESIICKLATGEISIF